MSPEFSFAVNLIWSKGFLDTNESETSLTNSAIVKGVVLKTILTRSKQTATFLKSKS